MIFPHWPQDHCCSPYRALNHPCDPIKSDLISVHPPEWWDVHPRRTSRLQEWAKSRKTANTEMPKADMKVKTGWGDSLRQKQSQQGECVKSDSSDPTSLYSHETESRSQQFLLSVLRNPGQVGSPETSRGNIDWKAKLDEYCIFVTNSLITVYRTTQLDLKQTKYDHFEPFYYCWDLLE